MLGQMWPGRHFVAGALAILLLCFAPPVFAQATQEDTRAAQLALQSRGYEVGPIDGIMGPRTKTALEEFQRKSSLTVTGAVDEPTLRALGLRKPDLPTLPPPAAAIPPNRGVTSTPLPDVSRPAQRAPATPVATPPSSPPSKSTSSGDNSGLIIGLIVAAVVFFFWRRGRQARLREEQARQAAQSLPSKGDARATGSASSPLSSDQIRIVVSTERSPPSYQPSHQYSRPTAELLKRQSDQCWVACGKAATLPG
jgi:peptidoglycan hydrolase-like protein with peptidoglycan-binding domain